MHVVLRRTCSDIQKDPGIDNNTFSWKSQIVHNFSSSSKEYEVSSVVRRPSDCSSTDMTLVVLEPDGLWRLLVLPQYLCREIHWRSSQSSLNGLQVGSLLPLTSLRFGGLKIQRVTDTDSLKSISSRSSLHHKGTLSNANKSDMLSIISSGQNSIIECEFLDTIPSGSDPGIFPSGSDAKSLENMYAHETKENRSTDSYSRKKPRKKGKRNGDLVRNDLNELQSAVGCSINEAEPQIIQHGSISSANICHSLVEESMTLGSISLGSSSDENCSQHGCKKIPNVDNLCFRVLESPLPVGRREVSSTGDILKSAREPFNHTEQKKCWRQSDRNVCGTQKKDKFLRSVPKDSDVYATSIGNQISDAREKRYQCIWQRVKKNDVAVSNRDLKKNLVLSRFDDGLKENQLNKKPPNPVDSIVLSQSPDKNQEKVKGLKNQRRKKSPDLLQEQCLRGSVSGACLKPNMQSSDLFGSASQKARAKSSINSVNSRKGSSSIRVRYQKKNVQHVSSEPVLNPESCSCNLEAKDNVPVAVSSLDEQRIEQLDLLSTSAKFLDPTEQQGNLPAVGRQRYQMDQEVSPSGQIEHEHDTVPEAGMSSSRVRNQKKNVQQVSAEPVLNPEACSCYSEARENVPIAVASVDDQMIDHRFDLLSTSAKFHDPTDQLGDLLYVGGEHDKMNKLAPSGRIKHEHATVPHAVSKSWMHQDIKDSELPKFGQRCLSVGMLVEPESWTSRNIVEEKLDSKCRPPASSSENLRVINAGQNSKNQKALPGVTQLWKLRNHNTCTLEEDCKNAASAKFLIPEAKSQTFSGLEIDCRSICQAVNDAHRAQLASKAIEIGKGYPAAEFEKLLHSASPVICRSANIRTCQACFCSQAIGAPLCRHEIPDISLGKLWQWYEKHGSYGLEVKAEDHKIAKWYGMDRIKFCAYFVPFLSAVQLFKDRRPRPIYNDNVNLGSLDVADSELKNLSSPSVDLRSILSVLVPQPPVKDPSSLPQRNVVSDSCSASECSNGDLQYPPAAFKLSDDMELLFEYFESEQPQRRRPLFEKIQELVSGVEPSSCRAYGDPSILQSVSLHDLHPNSWFSVAWYPIYKIPDGNLRASFLTYHSLGHFIHRSQTLEERSVDACVVSPIVGLQSYNAQGECWFQPRHSTHHHVTEESLDSDLPTIMMERLKTLEQTASVMSRAMRKNGSGTLANIHPDYEFFLSRRR